MELLELLKHTLLTKPSIKTKDLVRILQSEHKILVDKSEINRLLYKFQGIYFDVDASTSWSIIKSDKGDIKESSSVSQMPTKKEGGSSNFSTVGTVLFLFDKKKGVHKTREWTVQNFILGVPDGKNEMLFSDWKGLLESSEINVLDKVEIVFQIKAKRIKNGLPKNNLMVLSIKKI